MQYACILDEDLHLTLLTQSVASPKYPSLWLARQEYKRSIKGRKKWSWEETEDAAPQGVLN